MAPVGSAHCCDPARVPGRMEPIVNRGADSPPLKRRLAGAVVTGNKEQQPVATSDRLLKRPVDREPGSVECHPMQIKNEVGLDRTGSQAAIPGAVESRSEPPGGRQR